MSRQKDICTRQTIRRNSLTINTCKVVSHDFLSYTYALLSWYGRSVQPQSCYQANPMTWKCSEAIHFHKVGVLVPIYPRVLQQSQWWCRTTSFGIMKLTSRSKLWYKTSQKTPLDPNAPAQPFRVRTVLYTVCWKRQKWPKSRFWLPLLCYLCSNKYLGKSTT